MTKEERAAYMKAWLAKHPDYHRKWREQYRITGATPLPKKYN